VKIIGPFEGEQAALPPKDEAASPKVDVAMSIAQHLTAVKTHIAAAEEELKKIA